MVTPRFCELLRSVKCLVPSDSNTNTTTLTRFRKPPRTVWHLACGRYGEVLKRCLDTVQHFEPITGGYGLNGRF